MARKPIIAGNWKMNKNVGETEALIEELTPLVNKVKPEVVICVPFTDIAAAASKCAGTNIKVGAQNVAWADSGAFTGEVSADMLIEAGATHVIIGHSERRQYFGETDATVNARLKTALAKGLVPIVCVGETLDQREKNRTRSVLKKQVNLALEGVSEEDMVKIVVAYEPVWAIGTGKTATSEQAQDTVRIIRNFIAKLFDRKIANKVRIQYGGSMNASNAAELMEQRDIDGGLIGGASLKAQDFVKVVRYYEA